MKRVLDSTAEFAQARASDDLVRAAYKALSYLRPEVRWFAAQMEKTLRRNDHKGGWGDEQEGELLRRLAEELAELSEATVDDSLGVLDAADAVVAEAADVANYALMVSTNRAGHAHGELRSVVEMDTFESLMERETHALLRVSSERIARLEHRVADLEERRTRAIERTMRVMREFIDLATAGREEAFVQASYPGSPLRDALEEQRDVCAQLVNARGELAALRSET